MSFDAALDDLIQGADGVKVCFQALTNDLASDFDSAIVIPVVLK